MQKERARAEPKRTSVHFNYDSQSSSPPKDDSPSPALTIKTTHHTSIPDLLENFHIPICQPFFQDPRIQQLLKQPIDPVQRQQFRQFLEKLGREGDSGSEEVDFQEGATVFYGTSTDQRNSRSKRHNSQSKMKLITTSRPSGHQTISETNEDRTPPYPQNQQKPIYAVAATQTVTPPFRKRRSLDRIFKVNPQPVNTLAFQEFRQRHNNKEQKRRYPKRVTREYGRLKFWQCERIDYAKGGVWLQKNQEK